MPILTKDEVKVYGVTHKFESKLLLSIDINNLEPLQSYFATKGADIKYLIIISFNGEQTAKHTYTYFKYSILSNDFTDRINKFGSYVLKNNHLPEIWSGSWDNRLVSMSFTDNELISFTITLSVNESSRSKAIRALADIMKEVSSFGKLSNQVDFNKRSDYMKLAGFTLTLTKP